MPMRQNTLDAEEARPEGPSDESKTRRNRFKVTIYRLLWVALGLLFVASKSALGFKYTTASSIMDILCGLTGVGLYCANKFHDDPERWDWFFEIDRRREIHLSAVLLKVILLPPLVLSIFAVPIVCLICCFGTVGSAVFTALEDRFPQLPSAISMVFTHALTLTVLLSLLCCLFSLWVVITEPRWEPMFTHCLDLLIPVLASPGIAIIISLRNALYERGCELLGSFVFWATIMMPVPVMVVIQILMIAWGGRKTLDTYLADAKAQIGVPLPLEPRPLLVEPPPLLVESLPPHQIRTAIDTLGSSNGSLTEDCLRAWAWFLTSHQSPEDRPTHCVAPASFFCQLRKGNLGEVTTWDKDFDWNSVQHFIVPIQYNDPQHWAIARVNFRAKHIEYYSSLSNGSTLSQQAEAFNLLMDFVKSRRFWSLYEGWAKELLCPSRVPQIDSFNSNVFCCAVVEHLLMGQSPTEYEGFHFTTADAAAYRQRMIQALETLISKDRPASAASPPDEPSADSALHSSPVQRSGPIVVHGVQRPLE